MSSRENGVSGKRVSLMDVARRANVSHMAVSQAMNPRPGGTRVSAATAERIRGIAAEMNYQPNLAARQLRSARSKFIGAIVDSQGPMADVEVISAIERIASMHGFGLQVSYLHDDLEMFKRYTQDFMGRGIDGVLCLSHNYPDFGHQLSKLLEPFRRCVYVEQPLTKKRSAFVKIDYQRAGDLATQHMINRGCKRMAVLWPVHPDYPSNRDRRQGYRDALKRNGIAYDRHLSESCTLAMMDDIASASACLDQVLPYEPDGLIVASDKTAMWIIRALSDRGIKVPSDLYLVSTGYWSQSRAFMPSITSVDLRFVDVAVEAMQMLIQHIALANDEASPQQSMSIEPRLVMGQSCGETPSE